MALRRLFPNIQMPKNMSSMDNYESQETKTESLNFPH